MTKLSLPHFLSLILDRFGLYIVLPIFSPLILYPNQHLVHPDMSLDSRFLIIGLLLGIYPFMQFMFGPVYSQILHRMEQKNRYLISLILCAGTTILTAYSLTTFNLALLFFSRAISGIPSNLKELVFQQIRSSIKTHRHIALCEGIGFVSAVLLGGYFSDPLQDPSFSPGLPLLILVGLYVLNFILILPEPLAKARITNKKFTFFKNLEGISKRFHIPQIRALSFVYFAVILAWVTMLQFNSVYLIEAFHSTQWQITIAYLIIALFWSFGVWIIAGFQKGAFYPKNWLIVGLFLSVLGFGLPLFSPNIFAYYASAGIVTFILAITWSVSKKTRFFSIFLETERYAKVSHSMKYLALGIGPLLISCLMRYQVSFLHIFSGLILFIALFVFQKFYQETN